MGKGTLTIENTVNQGAGGLYFEGDFAVKPSDNNVTWQGAGVSVGEESTVEWQVHNPEGDRLSKIGLGTLLVNGKGKNLGSLSVGNGLVVLDQQADEAGQKQAFKEVGIVSGRATVKLNSENQVDPNNIYFGFRGGRLDLNGHSLTFKRIQNTDEGAMIVNHNATTESTVTITGSDTINNNTGDLTNKRDIAFNGWFGDKDDTKNTGRLNVTYNPLNKDNHFLLSGGTNLKGNITQEGGTLVFSGRPTPHAYNHLRRDLSNMEGIPQGEIVWDHDWINRTFKAENFQIKGGQAVVSRNVSAINGNWTINNNASATFGVTPNQENLVCIRSDWTGLTQCKSEKLTNEKTINSLPRTKVNGNVQLSNTASLVASGFVDLIGNVTLTQNSQFTLSHNATQTGSLSLINQANATVNNARLIGNVTLSDSAQFNLANSHFSHQISGTESTTVNLDNANWTMPASATLGDLALNNSEITLNPDFVTQANNSQFNTLTINGNLSGNGIFNYRTYLNQYLGDKLQINGRAQGDFKLNVHNTGAEPTTLEQLTLVTLKQAVDSGLNFTLANQHVDAGTWRYELIKKGNEYRLYNPIKEQELTQNLTNEAQKLSELLAKKTALTEKRYAQEEKVRSKRSVLSEALPDQSYLNTLKTELAALQRNQNAAQEVQNQKEMALTQAQSTVQAAQEKAQTATNAYESAKSLETAQALDEANIALATALVKKEEAQIEFATAKLTQLNLAKQQQEKALAVAEEEKVLSEKGASLQAEKQAFYFMVLSLEEVKEELIITEELLRQAQANNAELKAKKALLERDLEEQANQNKEAQTFKTNLAETLQEKATAAQEKAKAAEQNNSSLSDLNQANQAVIAKQQAVENLKNSTNVQAQALTAEQAKVEQDKTQAEHHKANAQQRQTVEQTMPVTAQFRQEEEKRIAEEKRLVEEAKHQAEEKHLAEEAKRQTEEKRLAEIVNHRKQKELISRYSNSALSELSATVNSMLSVQDELDRLFLSQTQPAVWTNIAQDNRRYDSNAFRAYQQKTNLRQIGGQKVLGDGRIGAVFSHSRSNNTFDEQVKNHATLTMVSGFAQYQWGNLQFGVNVGTGISSSKMAAEQSRKIHRKVMNYGANASYQFRLGQLGVQPYLGMNRYFIERENYQSEEVKVQTPSLTFNRYNAGVRVDYTFAPTNNISIKPYFSVNYVDVSNANTQTIVNSTTLQQPFGRYWQKEVGLNTEILHFQLSTFISQSQGSQLGKQRNMGVKLGYHW
ncbi:autotransporter outer membrane beta-barrel domain-containing protein [Haemophilus haemolyticus]|uniref:autotransporter outer membrane beta-barrel domain-containing protein n=2 Tax=Haemophilus haemolyticus TaxID=726 RepID=UPI003BA97DF2